MGSYKCIICLLLIGLYFIACGDSGEEACEELTWYQDADRDGLGDPSNTLEACIQPSGYVSNSDDDDDTGMDAGDLENLDFEIEDWTEASHSKNGEPDFSEVFSDNEVKRIDLVISPANWQVMQDDMTSLYGNFGSGGRGPGEFADENPVWVPAEVFYQGKQWYRVGARFKGNSSLSGSWRSGIGKLSFKLDFDEFEGDFPQIKNQRFFGFKQLSLKNNFDDSSFIREKVGGDLFKNAGMVGPHTAFYTLYVDHGDGPIYFGVYTMVEEVDDTVIDTQFADGNGNLYKPDGDAASFASGTFDEDELIKNTNESEGDWSDVKQLYDVLHNDNRTNDPAVWRSSLDAIFDTDVFLKYLAINTVMQNWDTYGRMTHNYFLYNNPTTGKLTWIPWDNNEALQEGKREGALNLNFSNLNGTAWPLIGFMYEDEVYREVYENYLIQVRDEVFNTAFMQSLYDEYAELLEPFVNMETSEYSFIRSPQDFQAAISTLKNHVSQREDAVNRYF